MPSGVVMRNVANFVNLSTPLGLLLALGARSRLRLAHGMVVADRAALPWVTASALTVGSVVLVPHRTLEEASAQIPGLLQHESEHAWQYAYCLGLPFLPLYLLATAWSLLRTRDRASANFFEVQAGLVLGGYRAAEPRPAGVSRAGDARSGRPAGRPGGGAGA